jgi:tetratricopeptide (TPR) repeat protein
MSRKRNSRSIEARANPQQRDLCRRDASKILDLANRCLRWLAPLLVALFTLTAFLPTLHNQFVAWDDDQNFVDNPHYRGLAWNQLSWMWTTFHMGHYAPLTWMTLGLDHLVWGMNPLGYQALRLKPDLAEAHYNLGNALGQQGSLAEAIEHFQQALRVKPDHADAHSNWGVALTRQGKLAEAIEHFQQAIHIKPDDAGAHYNWGVALVHQGKPAEAVEHFQHALRIQPDNAEAHNNWGMALAHQGKLAEAIEHYQQALRVQPENAEAHNNLARALAQQDKAR